MKNYFLKAFTIIGLIATAPLCLAVEEAVEHKLRLENTSLRIPLIQSESNSVVEVHTCRINNKGQKLSIKEITSNYMSNEKLLEDHIESCFKKEKAYSFSKSFKEKEKWKLSFEFGYSRTSYFNTDLHIDGAEVQGTIYDFNFEERTSGHFYNPATWDTLQKYVQWIDEPTNHFIITLEKGRHNVILSIFHPKWLIGNNDWNRVEGYVNGAYVDEYMDLDAPFEEDYSNFITQPGELSLVRFENTHLQMEFSIGYGFDFNIFSSKKLGELNFQPMIFAGIMTGKNLTVTRDPNNFWEFQDYETPFHIQGPMFALGAKVQWDLGPIELFYQFKYTNAQMTENDAWGGTVEYRHQYVTNTFGIGFDIPRFKDSSMNGERKRANRRTNKARKKRERAYRRAERKKERKTK
jgi:hypothetical protein